MRRLGYVLLLVNVLVVTVVCIALWVNEGPLWRWVMLERITFESHDYEEMIRGWHYVYRSKAQPYGKWHWRAQEGDPSVVRRPVPEPDLPNKGFSVWLNEKDVSGWETVTLSGQARIPHLRRVTYYVDNGFLAQEGFYENGWPVAVTQWDFDGTVQVQIKQDETGKSLKKESPPWWWNVADQTKPTAPWWHGKD